MVYDKKVKSINKILIFYFHFSFSKKNFIYSQSFIIKQVNLRKIDFELLSLLLFKYKTKQNIIRSIFTNNLNIAYINLLTIHIQNILFVTNKKLYNENIMSKLSSQLLSYKDSSILNNNIKLINPYNLFLLLF